MRYNRLHRLRSISNPDYRPGHPEYDREELEGNVRHAVDNAICHGGSEDACKKAAEDSFDTTPTAEEIEKVIESVNEKVSRMGPPRIDY